MNILFNVRRFLGSLTVLLVLLPAVPSVAFEIGGFDGSRGGTASLRDGMGYASVQDLRTAIQGSFPDVIISGASILTAEYLSGVQVVFLSSWESGADAVTPLSPTEQTALGDFVLGGGCALIFVDNHDLSDAAHESLLDPFGLDVTGKIDADSVPCTILDPAACPATMGPFATLTGYTVAKPGWFDAVGPHAVALDEMPNGEPSLAYIDFGVLGANSGAVLLCSDSSHLVNLYLHQQTIDLVNNMIAACIDQLSGVSDAPRGMTWSEIKWGYLGE